MMVLRKKNKEQQVERDKILLYYFAFPHYRAAILKRLKERSGDRLELFSGSLSRSGLKPLTKQELPFLNVARTKHIGSISWDRGIVKPAVTGDYATVVLGPAVASLSTWAILVLRKILGKKTYLWGQCGQLGVRSPKRFLQELMNRMATGLLVYGSLEEAGALELGTSSKKVFKVRNSVPLSPLSLTESQISERLQSSLTDASETGSLRLLYMGRINADKCVDVLLRAGELLKDYYPNISIRVVGDGPEIEKLREQFPDERYEFPGAIYESEKLHNELKNATFVVAPSKIGLLAIDALSVGVPVMIPDNPYNGSEFEALEPGVNGFSFHYEDSNDLAQKIIEALVSLETIDSELYYSSREKGLSDWSPETVAKNILGAISGDDKGWRE